MWSSMGLIGITANKQIKNKMSSYYNIKGLKVRLSDHEPNYSMDRMRGHNDIELYIKDACNKNLDVECCIEGILEHIERYPNLAGSDLQMEDFAEVIRDAKEMQEESRRVNYEEEDTLDSEIKRNPNSLAFISIEKQAFLEEIKGIDKEALKQALTNVHNFKARKSLIASIYNGLSNTTLNKLANENNEYWSEPDAVK